jgi:hypothetical protein
VVDLAELLGVPDVRLTINFKSRVDHSTGCATSCKQTSNEVVEEVVGSKQGFLPLVTNSEV